MPFLKLFEDTSFDLKEVTDGSYVWDTQSFSFTKDAGAVSLTFSAGAVTGNTDSWTSSVEWETEVLKNTSIAEHSMNMGQEFNFSTSGTCTISASIPITYTLAEVDGAQVPTWVEVDDESGFISGQAPNLTADTQFSFKLVATWDTSLFLGETEQVVNITVLYVEPEEEEEEDEPMSVAAQTAVASAQAGAAATTSVVLMTSLTSGTPPTSLWSLLHQLQMVILVSLIDPHIPSDVSDYLEGTDFALVNFNFLPTDSLPGVEIPIEWMDFEQPFEKLESLDLESRSTFVNMISFLLVLVGIAVFHLCLKLCCCREDENRDQGKCRKFFSKARVKILDLIVYILYVRLLMESHEIMMLSSAAEIYEMDGSTTASVISLVFAWLVFAICWIMPIIALYLFCKWFKHYDPKKKYLLKEFFEGIRNSKWARLYTASLLFRRAAVVVLVIFLPETLDRTYIYAILITSQALYLAILVGLRPFAEARDNVIESMNEVFLLVISCFLLAMNDESKWTDSRTGSFMTILTTNTMMISALIILFALFTLVKFIYKKIRSKSKTESKTSPKYSVSVANVKTSKTMGRTSQPLQSRYEDEESPDYLPVRRIQTDHKSKVLTQNFVSPNHQSSKSINRESTMTKKTESTPKIGRSPSKPIGVGTMVKKK